MAGGGGTGALVEVGLEVGLELAPVLGLGVIGAVAVVEGDAPTEAVEVPVDAADGVVEGEAPTDADGEVVTT